MNLKILLVFAVLLAMLFVSVEADTDKNRGGSNNKDVNEANKIAGRPKLVRVKLLKTPRQVQFRRPGQMAYTDEFVKEEPRRNILKIKVIPQEGQ